MVVLMPSLIDALFLELVFLMFLSRGEVLLLTLNPFYYLPSFCSQVTCFSFGLTYRE